MSFQDQGPQYTPQGYMPPTQVGQMYDYGKNLTAGGMRDKPITSPWQGVRMMADALAGRSMRNQAGQAETRNTFGAGKQMQDVLPPGMPSSPPTPYPGVSGAGPQSSMQPPPQMTQMDKPPFSGLGQPPMPPPGLGGGQDPMMASLMSQPPMMG